MRAIIQSAVQMFRAHPDSPDSEIVERLVESGVERPMAIQLVALLPIAYGRVTLSDDGVVFTDTYLCMAGPGKESREGRLSALPLWDEIMDFARREGEPTLLIACRSSEIRAANAALEAGKQLKDLIWGPPVFLWPMDSFIGPAGAVRKVPWWRQIWNSPAPYSVSRGELVMTRAAMVVGILAGLFALGLVGYYLVSFLREL